MFPWGRRPFLQFRRAGRNVEDDPVPPAAAGRCIRIVDGHGEALRIGGRLRPCQRGRLVAARASETGKEMLIADRRSVGQARAGDREVPARAGPFMNPASNRPVAAAFNIIDLPRHPLDRYDRFAASRCQWGQAEMVLKRSMMIPNCAIMTDAHDRTSLPMASRSAIDAGIPPRPLAAELRRRIAGSLQGGDDSQFAGPNGGTPITKLATYHARAVETIRDMTINEPALIVVLDGIKEVHLAGDMFEFHPGEPFVLPAGQSFDIVNRPDEASGRYRAVFITLPRDLVRRVAQAHPRRGKAVAVSTRKPHDPGIDLTPQAVDTISHAAMALSRTDLMPALPNTGSWKSCC